jgi:hypothetical protein
MVCQEEKISIYSRLHQLTAVPGVRACFGEPCGEGVVFDRSAARILILKKYMIHPIA